jgi:hypothetical protein
MATKDCPHCGLTNPAEAQRCDCGYDFTSHRMEPSYVRTDASQRLGRYWYPVLVVVILWGLCGLGVLGCYAFLRSVIMW